MQKLNSLIQNLEEAALLYDKINTKVSQASVGWHVEHSLKVITQIIDATQNSNPNEYKWRFNVNKILILGINKIPRGKGKAPKRVIPEGEINLVSLKQHVEKTRDEINKLAFLKETNYFLHPYFGNLNLKETKKFLLIHTNHHLKIIKDIVK